MGKGFACTQLSACCACSSPAPSHACSVRVKQPRGPVAVPGNGVAVQRAGTACTLHQVWQECYQW